MTNRHDGARPWAAPADNPQGLSFTAIEQNVIPPTGATIAESLLPSAEIATCAQCENHQATNKKLMI